MEKNIYHIVLGGRAKDVFAELEFMYLLEQATGECLAKYQVELEPNSQN